MSFFEEVLPKSTGWTPLILLGPKGGLTNFTWFKWPEDRYDMETFVVEHEQEDVYFSPFLYSEPPGRKNTRHATKANVIDVAVVWCDGDDMSYEDLRVKPTIYVQSSENHWQGYWRFTDGDGVSPITFEALSHGLYDAHASEGMDRGWPLSKKMRVPDTTNNKYGEPFALTWRKDGDANLTIGEFAGHYPPAEEALPGTEKDALPVDVPSPFDVLGKVNRAFITEAFLKDAEPNDDRSAMMYHLECALWEENCTMEEVFAVLRSVSYNKYNSDGRGDKGLWAQLQRDYTRWEKTQIRYEVSATNAASGIVEDRPYFGSGTSWRGVSLLRPGEIEPTDTFVDAFTYWASSKSKMSPKQFHVCGALSLLSTVLARYAMIPLSFGNVPLNLYFLVLGRTTQSRKSTSLRLAQRVIKAVLEGQELEEYLIPDDATPEALARYLSGKPKQSSILAIDEIQDMFAQASKKSGYLSAMIGFLTKAFDGDIPGLLRKGGDVKFQKATTHYMTLYGTGILSTSAEYLSTEKIETGFVPRCLVAIDDQSRFIVGSDDLEFMKQDDASRRVADAGFKAIVKLVRKRIDEFQTAYDTRAQYLMSYEDGRIPLECEPEAFARWQEFCRDATQLAADHEVYQRELFPTIERMTMSTLKIAGLLAMVEGGTMIKMRHMLKAIALASIWMPSSETFVREVVNSGFSKSVDDIISWVSSRPKQQVLYIDLLAKFQSRFANGRQLTEALSFAQQRGALGEVMSGREKKDRLIVFTGKVV